MRNPPEELFRETTIREHSPMTAAIGKVMAALVLRSYESCMMRTTQQLYAFVAAQDAVEDYNVGNVFSPTHI